MALFNVTEWLEARSKLNIQQITIEDISFEVMALTDEQVMDIKELDNSEDILDNAADMGLSFNRKRVFDDSELSKDLAMLWALEVMPLTDPTVKAQVGRKICEISGLADFLDEVIELETNAIDGDNLTEDGAVTMGDIEANRALATAV